MRLYNGDGNFNFTFAHNLPTGTHGAKGKFHDIDNDGDLDIVNISSGSAARVALHVFENVGNTFNKSSYLSRHDATFFQADQGFNPLFFILDVNRDNRLDVISFSVHGAPDKERMNSWVQNADKSFTAEQQALPTDMSNTGGMQFMYFLKDINNDNYKDLLFFDEATDEKNVKVAYSEAQIPHFGAVPDFQGPSIVGNFIGDFLQKAVWGDVDNDGQEDFVTHNLWLFANNSLEVIKDPLNSNGNFSKLTLEMGNKDIHKRGHGLLLTDLDNDNDIELISLGNDDILRIFNNDTLKPEVVVEEACSEKDFKIYPSPAKEYIQIDMCESQAENIRNVQIYSMTGDLVGTIPQAEWKNPISTSGLVPGAYILHVEMINGKKFSKKFLKE